MLFGINLKSKFRITFLFILIGMLTVHAQKDTTKTNTNDADITKGRIKLPFPKAKDPLKPQDKAPNFMEFKTPSLLTKKKTSLIKLPESKRASLKEEKEIDFTGQERYVTRNKEFERKLNKKDKQIRPEYKVEQYLGDFKSNGEFVEIVCRDHEFVDGDRVRVYVNDVVVVENIRLEAVYKKLDITLKKGFNKIDFQALNQGSSGPNTAEFRVYDDKGELISANEWNLTTGIKATMIIVKE
ncbi:hypothetical protein U8527_12110 [Kordia algicida OT-1]|uniref:Secreted protein n=1 Tax=Kordia algicida OT-1 TaxID=391587 RepID=A9E0I6_9FLAO|nr:hypothetical protein [Kordia algicida]EDP95866.1 hypothetical protein KAOT1_05662 [Kordia algicida OT-1]